MNVILSDEKRIPPTSPEAPSRVIVRASAAFMVRGVAEGIRCYGGMRRVLIINAIVVANVQHITRSALENWRYAGLDEIPPDSERRPVSIKSLSDSLGTPFETTRANVAALVQEGLCVKTPAGVIVPNAVLQSERMARCNAVLSDCFWEMIAELKSLDFDFEAVTGRQDLDSTLVVEPGFISSKDGKVPVRLITRITSQFYLNAILAGGIIVEDDLILSVIFAALMSINSEDMARHRGSAWAYSRPDTPPPDAIRRSARIAEVAVRVGIDKESARRHVMAMAKRGWVIRTPKGYLVSMEHMQSPQGRRSAMEVTKTFYRMIYDLTALGLRF